MTTPMTRRNSSRDTRHRGRRRARGAGIGIRAGACDHPAAVGADRHLESAARLRPRRAAHDLLHRSRRPDDRSGVQRARAGEHVDHASVDRRALDRRAGLEQPGTLPPLERHSQQPAAAMARRRRAGVGLPEPVEQQQRQHLRPPGTPALLRTPHAPRRPLRARRIGHGHRRDVPGQAIQLAERRRRPSRRRDLVHRSAVRRAALRGADATAVIAASASCRPMSTASIRAAASTW